MTKFNLISFDEKRQALLDELQRFEYVHFSDTSDLREEKDLENVELPLPIRENEEELSQVKWLISLLEPRADKKGTLKSLKEGLDWYSVDELKEKGSAIDIGPLHQDLEEKVEKIESKDQEIKSLRTSLDDLKPWKTLETSISELSSTSRVKVLTGTIPVRRFDEASRAVEDLDDVYLELVSKDSKNAYVIGIILNESYNEAIEALRQKGFNNASIPGKKKPSEEMKDLEEKIEGLKEDIKSLEEGISSKTDRLEDLKLRYEYLANKKLELSAAEKFVDLEGIDYIRGYIPTNRVSEFTDSLSKLLGSYYYIELEEANKKDDSTPVLLENNKLVEPYQSLTSMYSTPKYSEVDPTPFFFIFYWVFFGMMVADFGYGALMAIITGIALKTFNLSESMRSSVKFFFMLSISTMIWGLIYSSAFGNPLPYEPLIDTSNYVGMLILSIVMGAVHLFFGLGVKAYMYIKDGKVKDAIYDVVFWYMTLVGVALVLLGATGVVSATLKTVGLVIMIIGMVGIILFAGRQAKSLPARLVLGVYDLYGISSWVGDFISYSRLMALGLSGGFIAMAINMIIDMMPDGIVGIIAGVVIFLIGHAFNIFLSYLSAYVHDIRLTYVEFFGKFFEGGGKAFEKFRNKTKYINLK